MQTVIRKDIERLNCDPLGFAMLMDNDDIEQVIVTFVMVLNERKKERGDPHQDPNTEPDRH